MLGHLYHKHPTNVNPSAGNKFKYINFNTHFLVIFFVTISLKPSKLLETPRETTKSIAKVPPA